MAGVVHVPWYATGLRGDKLEAALTEIVPVALRYGATSYSLFRYRDDKYKFLQTAEFEEKSDFEAYWYGPEFTDMKVVASSWYTVPLLYGWTTLVTSGSLSTDSLAHSATGGLSGDEPADLAG